MTAADTVASKAEEPFVLLGKDPEQTVALPRDEPKTAEPADKQNKTIVADTTASNKQDKTVEAKHAATYEAALKKAAPDAPPSVGDAATALKDATLRELGAAREKASFKMKAAARAARRNAPAWRRVGRWALGLLALAVVFAGGFFLGERRGGSVVTSASVADTAPPSANQANALTNHVPPTNALANEPPADASSTNDASPTCRTRPPVDSLFDNIVNEILGLRAQPRPRRAEPLDAFVRQMLSPAPRVVPTMDVSFGWPGLELTVPFLRREASNQRALHAARHQAAQVQQRRLQEQRRLEHARHEAAYNRQALEEQRRLEHARHEAARRQAQKAAAVKDLEERLAKAEKRRLHLAEQRTTEPMPVVDTDVVEPAEVDAAPAVEPTPAPTRPARDALRELSIKQLRNILAARGGAPCTTCKEKDDLVAAVMAVLDD